MPVWTIDSIEDRQNVSLRDWAVFEVPLRVASITEQRDLTPEVAGAIKAASLSSEGT